MFSGLVEQLGQVAAVTATNQGAQITIHLENHTLSTIGASVAINGVCLTVIELQDNLFKVEASKHTLTITTLGSLTVGVSVNIEYSLALGKPIHGHLVAGHVDTVTTLKAIEVDGNSSRWILSIPSAIKAYLAPKGSVCLQGVSLTIEQVQDTTFSVVLIPHTLQVTTLGTAQVGQLFNIEADLLARYCARILQYSNTNTPHAERTVPIEASLYDTMIEGQRA